MADDRNHPHDHIDDATLTRYLSGACEAEELARVERWLAADPANRAELDALRQAWALPPVPEADPDDRVWNWLSARMDSAPPRPELVRDTEPASTPASTVQPPRRARRAYGGYPVTSRRTGLAAAAVVLLTAGALLWQLPGLFRPAAERAPAVAAAARELVTTRGERATGNLPDGSRVILGPDSRLRIPADYAPTPGIRGTREVHLEGEAFFEVTHDSTRPFRVHTPNGIAEDLGTEFVVTAYPETRTTRVVVASGIVELSSRAPGASSGAPARLTLVAGDLGRIDAAGAAALTRNVDLAGYVDWTRGTLVFDETPLDDAIARLARWYDLDIRIADPALKRRGFTATFREEPVERVLRVLEIALDLRAERNGRVVILRPPDSAGVPDR